MENEDVTLWEQLKLGPIHFSSEKGTSREKEKADKYKTLFEMVTGHGYPIEKHLYETPDGYVNCVHRVSGPRGTLAKDNAKLMIQKPVIILQHGFMDSSASFLCDGPDSMALFLADLGYDVWLNNTRGNKFSKQHRFLDACEPEFWDFSFQEMAEFDQPALFDFVLKKTGVEKVTYIGHSQGTMQMFAALCENLDFFKPKLNLVIMLAPVTRPTSVSTKRLQFLADN